MKTYSEICEELDEATGKQRVMGAIAAGAIATGAGSQLDKEPAPTVKHPATGVSRQVVKNKPHGKPGDPFVVNGITYHPYFPNLAYKVNNK